MNRIINRHFALIIYLVHLGMLLLILAQLRGHWLLPMPEPGTDQRSMLSAAAALSQGRLWPQGYLYSPIYTVFLAALVLLSRGEILVMRIIQACLCALVPVMIYKTARNLRMPFIFAQMASFIYCFYAASALISLDFLRAAPLSLAFISYSYFLIRAYRTRKTRHMIFAGLCAAACVLGRENFIPVVAMPALFLASGQIRRSFTSRSLLLFAISALLPIFLVCAINFSRFGKFSVLPGNAVNVIGFYYPGHLISLANIALLKDILARCPGNFLKYISSYEIPNSLSVYSHMDFSAMLRIMAIPFNAILVTAAAMPLLRRNRGSILLYTLASAYFLSMLIFEPFYRFRIPAVPILCVICAISIHAISRMDVGRSIAATAAILLAIIMTWDNPQPKRPVGERISTIRILASQGLLATAEKRISELESDGHDVSNLKPPAKSREGN